MRILSTRRLPLAAAALAGVAALSTLAGCGSDDSTAADPATEISATSTPTTPAPLESVTPTESATSQPAAPQTPAADALITLAQPTEGQVVSGSFAVAGEANSPEANVPWTLTNAAGKVVASGAFTAEGWMDKLYPFTSQVSVKTAPAGDYTFSVAVDDDSDGESKLPEQSVSVHLTVQ